MINTRADRTATSTPRRVFARANRSRRRASCRGLTPGAGQGRSRRRRSIPIASSSWISSRPVTRLLAVGERGFVLLSDDAGKTWKAVPTPVTRTLTGCIQGRTRGVAVGHGASIVRTEDGGSDAGSRSRSMRPVPTRCSASRTWPAITSSHTAHSASCSIPPTRDAPGRGAR